jgi:hypothetical protein
MQEKSNVKTLFLILGSESPEHQSDLLMQQNTWLKDLLPSQSYRILRGSNAQELVDYENTLYIPVKEEYKNILSKSLIGLRWALENTDFDVVIRTNVSTYFPTNLVQRIVSSIDVNSKFFGGYLDRCRIPFGDKDETTSYVAGTALVMTRPTVVELVKLDWSLFEGWPDDLAISVALRRQGITPKSIKRNNLSQMHFFFPAFQIRLKTSSVDHLAAVRMKNVHAYFKSQKPLERIKLYLLITISEVKYSMVNFEEFFGFTSQILVRIKNLMLSPFRIGR